MTPQRTSVPVSVTNRSTREPKTHDNHAHSVHAPTDHAPTDHVIDRVLNPVLDGLVDNLVDHLIDHDLDSLMAKARGIRDARTGSRVTYSPKVFIPLTMLCRDSCGYCTFAQPPARLQ
ncbi:MAG: hypothetical protein EB010_14000, partial [Acidimicrobiia bacterium]|nr:hypothetical protein [Acidimicrobiia bacterium]